MCLLSLIFILTDVLGLAGNNIGYKHQDATHPCRQCWRKYGRPFTGAITYTDFTSAEAAQSGMQRPLPNFQSPARPNSAPGLRPQHTGSMAPGAAYRQPGGLLNGLERIATRLESRLDGGYNGGGGPGGHYRHNTYHPGPSYYHGRGPNPNPAPMGMGLGRQGTLVNSLLSPSFQHQARVIQQVPTGYHGRAYGAPAGATVYQPGDARIGGRLCPVCDGSGKMFLGLECLECDGIGRVFSRY